MAISTNEINCCYNTKLIDVKNNRGLVYLSIHVVKIVALCIDVVNTIIRDRTKLTTFKKTLTNGIACMNVLK